MSIELKKLALELAAAGVDGTVDGIVQRATAYYAFLSAPDDAAPNDKPKTRRSKNDSAPADGAASEPSTPNASKLEPADEGKGGGPTDTLGAGTTEATTGGTSTSAVSAVTETPAGPTPAGPTRDDALTEATKFSQLSAAQGGGADALEAVLRQFGALDGETPRFSRLTEAQYGDFIAEMKKRKDAASVASNALS